jgi:hypothetical protein
VLAVKSARGLAHSGTLARVTEHWIVSPDFGMRQTSAALVATIPGGAEQQK